jgi:hypothetical protein
VRSGVAVLPCSRVDPVPLAVDAPHDTLALRSALAPPRSMTSVTLPSGSVLPLNGFGTWKAEAGECAAALRVALGASPARTSVRRSGTASPCAPVC